MTENITYLHMWVVKKEKVHLSTYDTNVIQLGITNNKMATPAPVQLQLPLMVSGLVFLCICLCPSLISLTTQYSLWQATRQ